MSLCTNLVLLSKISFPKGNAVTEMVAMLQGLLLCLLIKMIIITNILRSFARGLGSHCGGVPWSTTFWNQVWHWYEAHSSFFIFIKTIFGGKEIHHKFRHFSRRPGGRTTSVPLANLFEVIHLRFFTITSSLTDAVFFLLGTSSPFSQISSYFTFMGWICLFIKFLK